MVLEGYDHILDVSDPDRNSIIDVANARRNFDLVEFLKSLHDFEVIYLNQIKKKKVNRPLTYLLTYYLQYQLKVY